MNPRLIGLLRLFRVELPLAAGICVLLGGLLAAGTISITSNLVFAFFSVFCLSATALILNDYFDLESDRINAPDRPLPSGMVTKRDVVILSVVVALLGFGGAALISSMALGVALVVWMIGFLYNWRFKRSGLPGNLMVSVSVGMTFLFGGVAVGRPYETIVWFFAILALLINLGEEIAADAMDAAGDRQSGSRSLAVVYGPMFALQISAGIFVGVVLLSSVPFLLGWLAWIYLMPLVCMDVAILYATRRLLDTRIANRRPAIRWIYLSASAALAVCIILRLIEGSTSGGAAM